MSDGVKGTYDWLAPEILKILKEENSPPSKSQESQSNKRGTVKSDVFTEGLVFGYFLLDGVHLFGSSFEIQVNILGNKPTNLESKEVEET
jgi:serine/threonine protein kinase